MSECVNVRVLQVVRQKGIVDTRTHTVHTIHTFDTIHTNAQTLQVQCQKQNIKTKNDNQHEIIFK